jgi:hypothetical protein
MGDTHKEAIRLEILKFRADTQNEFADLVSKYVEDPSLFGKRERRVHTKRARLIKDKQRIKQLFMEFKTLHEVADIYGVGKEYMIHFVKEEFGKEFYYDYARFGGRLRNG